MVAQLRTFLIILVLAVGMILLGRLIGGVTAPEGPISEDEVERLLRNLDQPTGNRIDSTSTKAFAGLSVPITDIAHWPSVLEELKLARQYGVQTFILDTDLPWEGGEWSRIERIKEALSAIEGGDLWLSLDLNPTPTWLEAHPDETSSFATEGVSFPSIGSAEWRNAGSTVLFATGQAFQEAFERNPVAGVILKGLEQGTWSRTVGYDRSESNTAEFQEWLERHYGDLDALNASWQQSYAAFHEVSVPEPPVEWKRVFFTGAVSQPYVDYMHYLNAGTVNAILFFADSARQAFGAEVKVYAQYGASFDLSWPEQGQWAIGAALDGSLDGLALGMHRADRSLGAVGGEGGPSTVPGLRGKHWILLDETRTGIGWNPTTNSLFTPAGFDTRTVEPIYDRNLLSAAMESGGVFWSDARGTGNFLDKSLWDYFASRVPIVDELQHARTDNSRTVVVVLDENSMHYVADGARVGDFLINGTRRAVQQAGVSYGYVLLEDLVAGRAPEARVFIFPNLFAIDALTREFLHAYLAEHGAAAIWLYAPGALSGEDSAAAVSELVRMNVEAYVVPVFPHSKYKLTGSWIEENDTFGDSEPWFPLFYVEDEQADALASYSVSDDSSVAVKFMEEGWASVFVAVPGLAPELLREVLDILDHPPLMHSSDSPREQSFAMRDRYILLHAKDQGDRHLDFRDTFDVEDLLNEDTGWPQKQQLQVPFRAGETRLLKLSPVSTELTQATDEPSDAPEEELLLPEAATADTAASDASPEEISQEP